MSFSKRNYCSTSNRSRKPWGRTVRPQYPMAVDGAPRVRFGSACKVDLLNQSLCILADLCGFQSIAVVTKLVLEL